jgi:uncharacterized protein YciI
MKSIAMLLFLAVAASASPFLITYRLPAGINLASLTAEQKKIFMAHGERFMKMQMSGVAYTGGHTTAPDNVLGIAIVEAKDEAEARALAANDPAVEAGLLNWTAQPFAFLVPPANWKPPVNDAKRSEK